MSHTSLRLTFCSSPFFFNDAATTVIYTLSLHDALPISIRYARAAFVALGQASPTPQDSPRFEILAGPRRSEEHTSELQSHSDLVCRLLLEKKKEENDSGKEPD